MKHGGVNLKNSSHKILLSLLLVAAGVLAVGLPTAVLAHSQNEAQPADPAGQRAPRLQNPGNHKFPVTTNSELAQYFINQGMVLAHGFNHAEGARSFREAARLDPACAMA